MGEEKRGVRLGKGWNCLVRVLTGGSCGCESSAAVAPQGRRVFLVGSPNVGKSMIFQRLTGVHATVSNYPGTTVELSHGRMKAENEDFDVVDTPGMYSLLPITEEERVARRILLSEHPHCVVHVVDAKDLERMLSLTLQLLEAEVPLMLVLNMMDEAESAGIRIEVEALEEELGVPVVATVATSGLGIDDLRKRIAAYGGGRACSR